MTGLEMAPAMLDMVEWSNVDGFSGLCYSNPRTDHTDISECLLANISG